MCIRDSYKVHQLEAVPEEDWVRVPNTHEAIIDRATFDKVQSLLKRETRTCLLYTSPVPLILPWDKVVCSQ